MSVIQNNTAERGQSGALPGSIGHRVGEAALMGDVRHQRVGGLVEIPGLLRELGADPALVLARAGLEANALDHADRMMPYLSAARLLNSCAEQTGCAHFGLLAGQRWRLSHFGVLGQLMKHSRSVREALRVLAVYQRLHSNVGAAFVLEHNGLLGLGYAVYGAGVPHQDQIYDLAIAFAYNILRELCGPQWSALEIVLSRPQPADAAAAYRKFFQAPVRFNHHHSAVWFAGNWGNRAIAGADPERRRALTAAIEAASGTELVSQLHRSLHLLLLEGKSSGDDLAQTLSLHRRTLNRRLKVLGTTFQKILDEVRFEMACQLLRHTDTPIEEIAAALCYGEVSAFTHAFRRWSATTPAQWRRTAGAQ